MPYAHVRGIELNYQIFGSKGDWVALSPGARHPFADFVPLAKRMAAAGYRVLLHDRRNCGASDVNFDGDGSEADLWADDLHALFTHLEALPAVIGGSSSGCRLGVTFALRYPLDTRALLLWRVTGGAFAAKQLAESYYGQYIALARHRGMSAVAESEHFNECIRRRASNQERLMSMDPRAFIAVMTRWRDEFLHGADMPIIGATAADLRSISQPACLVPGNDAIHTPAAAAELHRLLQRSEFHHVVSQRSPENLLPQWDKAEWDAKEMDLAEIFTEFLRKLAAAPSQA